MTKLSNKQLKKLYDYGGTLSPRDWADAIDSLVPENVDLFEELKHYKIQTYKEQPITELKPNTLYVYPIDFKYNQYNGFYSETLMIYLNPEDHTKLKCIADYNIYDIGDTCLNEFIADFKFDGVVKISWNTEMEDEIYSDCGIKSTHIEIFDTSEYADDFINMLKISNISYEKTVNDLDEIEIIVKDVAYLGVESEWQYEIISNGDTILYSADGDNWYILENNTDLDSSAMNVSCSNAPLIYNITLKNGLHQDYFVMNALYMDDYLEDIVDVSNLEIIDSPIPGILCVNYSMDGISGFIKNTDLNTIGDISTNIIAINGVISLIN